MFIKKILSPALIISTLSAPIAASSYTNQKNIEKNPLTIAVNLCSPFPECKIELEQNDLSKTTQTTTDSASKQPAPVNLSQDLKSWWENLLGL